MAIYLADSFVLSILPPSASCRWLARIEAMESSDVAALVGTDFISLIDRPNVAAVLATEFGFRVPIAESETAVMLAKGDTLYVAQYVGPRLPDDATELPERAGLGYFSVTVKEAG